jgi:hypothetical protein
MNSKPTTYTPEAQAAANEAVRALFHRKVRRHGLWVWACLASWAVECWWEWRGLTWLSGPCMSCRIPCHGPRVVACLSGY